MESITGIWSIDLKKRKPKNLETHEKAIWPSGVSLIEKELSKSEG